MIGLLGRSRRDSMRKAAPQKLRHKSNSAHPLVGVIMGSKSDWETMANTTGTLERLGIPFEVRVVSAHRTPAHLFAYADSAERRGLQVISAGAGGAAHLRGVQPARPTQPLLGFPGGAKA